MLVPRFSAVLRLSQLVPRAQELAAAEPVRCPSCYGSGWRYAPDEGPCGPCGGFGSLTPAQAVGAGHRRAETTCLLGLTLLLALASCCHSQAPPPTPTHFEETPPYGLSSSAWYWQ